MTKMVQPPRKLRLYLDTSVISDINSGTKRGVITREFFGIVRAHPEEYELVISPMTIQELRDAPEKLQRLLFAIIEMMGYVELPDQVEAEKLAQQYVVAGVLGEKHIDDLIHIAYGVLARCDYVISWNMKHIVRAKTISAVHEFNRLNFYHSPNIATPTIITGE